MGIVYAISANKGGVGKTSFVTNLAAAIVLKKPKARVLIVDTDAQGNAALAFGKTPKSFENTIYEVMAGGESIEAVRINLMDRLDLVPSNVDMDFLDFDVLTNQDRYKRPFNLLQEPLERIRAQYDYIFIDTPPAMGLVAGNVLVAADRVIVPFAPETFAVAGIVRVLEAINDFKEKQNSALQIDGMVGMMVDSRTVLHSEMLAQARKYCHENGYHLYETIIPRSIRFAASTAYEGKPAVLSDSDNHIVAAYFKLMTEVLEHGEKRTQIG
ncbi:ParA family protein [Paenibacillus sp. UASWS1643]|uniref:ParA family protein n=1 Tax=Paenibacillus sp. UASWS1643 TaxID=2580422 RepID=UPI001238E70F|nr:ParA family protein [Paenibacillus sp. UASWS1643]KAA8757778.1 ParA family protein [Paenibacillus sp. UASWS1643]